MSLQKKLKVAVGNGSTLYVPSSPSKTNLPQENPVSITSIMPSVILVTRVNVGPFKKKREIPLETLNVRSDKRSSQQSGQQSESDQGGRKRERSKSKKVDAESSSSSIHATETGDVKDNKNINNQESGINGKGDSACDEKDAKYNANNNIKMPLGSQTTFSMQPIVEIKKGGYKAPPTNWVPAAARKKATRRPRKKKGPATFALLENSGGSFNDSDFRAPEAYRNHLKERKMLDPPDQIIARQKPTTLDELVGQGPPNLNGIIGHAGPKGAIAQMREWMQNFIKRRTGTPKCLLLVGLSGVGKTCAAHLLLKEMGYVVYEYSR